MNEPIRSALSCGSSPRMWGTVIYQPAVRRVTRFIPTYVGNRPDASRSVVQSSVHPHVCGEQRVAGVWHQWDDGSSPRMWGTESPHPASARVRRFIPTYVGNRSRVDRPSRVQSVHPHVCGEQAMNYWREIVDLGSSPRMWGTDFKAANQSLRKRFIPTYVGNRPSIN